MDQIVFPDKLYFRIGEVAKIVDVAPHVLRYWESEFTGIQPKRTHSRQRLYRRQDVELILKIKSLLRKKGFTITGAKSILARDKAEQTRKTSETNLHKLKQIKKELLQIQTLLTSQKE